MPSALKKSADIPDEKQAILDKLGDLSQVQIAQNELLVAIYVRPEFAPGGMIALTHKTRKEDIYQGKGYLPRSGSFIGVRDRKGQVGWHQ